MNHIAPFLPLLFLLCLLPGCANRTKIVKDINYTLEIVDKQWEKENASLRADFGDRTFFYDKLVCFRATSKALNNLGFIVVDRDFDNGFINGKAFAPAPFNKEEWEFIRSYELKRMKEEADKVRPNITKYLMMPIKKIASQLTVSLREEGGGTTISLFPSIVDRNDTKGFYPMKYAPPTAAKLGMDKFWRELEKELAGRPSSIM